MSNTILKSEHNKKPLFDNSIRTNQTLHISEVMKLMPIFNQNINISNEAKNK